MSIARRFFICIILVCLTKIIQCQIVNTSIGVIQGSTSRAYWGDYINAYYGVPYAIPPINDLRFASPEPITEAIGDESNPYNATGPLSIVPTCIQAYIPGYNSGIGTEDCLYLNIFQPLDAKYKATNYTVMIWIHGGAYVVGSSSESKYDATNFVSYIGDIIIVSINYRLGVMGFMYDNTFETGVVGNYGYEDVKLAIKWVYDNIEYFGGNPDSISIFGSSAGAGMVSLQLLYNKDGYIKSGIMQSPWPNPFRSYPTPSSWDNITSSFNEMVNCSDYESVPNDLLNCWRNLSSTTILNAQLAYFIIDPYVLFIPTIGSSELLYQPLYAFTDGSIDNIPPYIIGTDKDEGYLFTSYVYDDSYEALLETIDGQIGINDFEISETILDFYNITQNESLSGDYTLDFGKIWSDIWRCSVRYQLQLLGDNTDNIYYYNFDIDSFENDFFTREFYFPLYRDCWKRACHGIENYFIFDVRRFGSYGHENNKTIAINEMMEGLWSNFAKTFDPNTNDGIMYYDIWPQYTNDDGENNFVRMVNLNEFYKKSIDTDSEYMTVCAALDKIGFYSRGVSLSMDETTTTTMTTLAEMTTTEEREIDNAPPHISINMYFVYIVITTLTLFLL